MSGSAAFLEDLEKTPARSIEENCFDKSWMHDVAKNEASCSLEQKVKSVGNLEAWEKNRVAFLVKNHTCNMFC